jgi:hypothetical protein
MAIVLDETIVLGMAALVFVPVFIFCIKMIMKVGTLEQKIDQLCHNVTSLIHEKKEIERAKQKLNLMEYQMKEVSNDVDYIMKKTDNGMGMDRTRDRVRRERTFRNDKHFGEENNDDNGHNNGDH